MPVAEIKNNVYLKGFAIAWTVIIAIQFVLLHFYYNLDFYPALADALVFNLTFAFAGYLLWFVIRYNINEKKTVFDKIVQHFITAIFVVGAWYFIAHYTLRGIFSSNERYLEFLNGSLVLRIITGFLFYIVYVLIYYVIIYYEDLQEKLKRETELQNLAKEAELSALKSQINPHFLFNSLNSISSLTITSPEKAQEMIIKLSDFLRYSLSGNIDSVTSLENEFDNILKYLEIEKIRFGKRLKFIFNFKEDCYDVKVPSLILQPLIENAVKHGVYNSSEEVKIRFVCERDENFTIIKISNDYDLKAVRKKGEGIGLKNIQERMKLIYKRQDLFKVYSGDNIFTAELKVPNVNLVNN